MIKRYPHESIFLITTFRIPNPKDPAITIAKIQLIGSIRKYAERNDSTIADATNPIIVHANLDFHHLIQVDIVYIKYVKYVIVASSIPNPLAIKSDTS